MSGGTFAVKGRSITDESRLRVHHVGPRHSRLTAGVRVSPREDVT